MISFAANPEHRNKANEFKSVDSSECAKSQSNPPRSAGLTTRTDVVRHPPSSNRSSIDRTDQLEPHPDHPTSPSVIHLLSPSNQPHFRQRHFHPTKIRRSSKRQFPASIFKRSFDSNSSQFRFKIKLWLSLVLVLLNVPLHSLALATTTEPQQTCFDLSKQLKSSFHDGTCVSSSVTNITIGYLSNINSPSGLRVGLSDVGAIRYAIREVNNNGTAGPGRKLHMIKGDTQANPVYSTNSMLSQVANGALAFIGPDSSCLTEATVAAALNLPMISYVSFIWLHFARTSS